MLRLRAAGTLVADPRKLQLSRRQKLKRVVVEGAGEPAPGLVAAGGDVGKQMSASCHRLAKPLDRHVELVFSLPVLPHESAGRRHDAQQPRIVVRESAPGVVGRQHPDPPITGRPGDRDRVAKSAQAVCAPELVELRASALSDFELVAQDDALGDAFAVA